MADIKITDLTEDTVLNLADWFITVDEAVIPAVTKKLSLQSLVTFLGGNSNITWGNIIGTIANQADLTSLVDAGVTHTKSLTNNASTDLFEFTLPNNTSFSCSLEVTIEGFDGTDLTVNLFEYKIAIINKGGVISSFASSIGSDVNKVSGTLFADQWVFANTTTNPVVISINPGNLGSSFSGGHLTITYHLKVPTGQAITYL